MKKLSYLSSALFCLLAASACIEDDLNPCPPDGGGVTVTLRAEKFLAQPPYGAADYEPVFGMRIRTLDYLLYADGQLVDQGRATGVAQADGESYVLYLDTLPFGNYRIAFAANTEPSMMEGSTSAPELRYIVYQGGRDGIDPFRAVLPFEVACPYRNEVETVLQRVHGVTRFRFEGIPAEVETIEVSLDRLGERMSLSGDPDRECRVTERIRVADFPDRTDVAFTLGTFPTLPGARSSWRLRLFAADAYAPVYDRVVTDTLRIERNRLLELKAGFREAGRIDFSVEVDTTWDGSNESGGEVTVS